MAAVVLCVRALLRRKVAGTVAVAVLVAVAGASVLAAWSGARRTITAYPRLLAATHAADVTVGMQGFGVLPADDIARLPYARGVDRLVGFGMAARPESGIVAGEDLDGVFAAACAGCRAGETHEMPLLLRGRLPHDNRVDEVMVNEIFARQSSLEPGDRYHAVVYSFVELQTIGERLKALGREPTQEEVDQVFTPVDLNVVGVGRFRGDLITNENQNQAGVLLSPAFASRYADKVGYEFVTVRLDDPRNLARFQDAVRRQLPDVPLFFQSTADDAATFRRAVSPYADALRLFALIAALTGLLVIGQALVRMTVADGADAAALDAVGCTRVQRAGVRLGRAAVAAVVGALGAVVIAFAVSPLFPLGRARSAEPSSGLHLDVATLGLGAPAMTVLLLVPVALLVWRSTTRTAAAASRPSRVVEALVRAGGPVTMVSGLRFALQRDRAHGRSSLGANVFGLVAAVVTLGAALVFAANLDRLVTDPQVYGWNWDALIDTYDTGATPEITARVTDDRDLVGLTSGSRASLVIDGHTVPAFGFGVIRGDTRPEITAGRWPTSDDEIALGAQTLRDLHKAVGETVSAHAADGAELRFRIVGRTILPSLALNGTYGLGEGAALTATGLARLDEAASPSFFLADLRDGVSVATVHRRVSDVASALGPQRPGDVQSYEQVRATPLVLGGLLTALGVGVLVHLLVTSIRNRRRDFAILKTLGFTRRQVASTVAWQATMLIAVALAVGIPASILLGRLTWLHLAHNLGVGDTVAIPLGALALVCAAALVLANLIAAVPARAAARLAPARVLRSE